MTQTYPPLKKLLLGMAAERSRERLLKRITSALASQPQVALARVWLLAPGDRCAQCPKRQVCPQNIQCLQLIASAGTPRASGADWSQLNGAFSRIPPGVGKVGRALSEPASITDIEQDNRFIVDLDWARREQLRGFGAAPLRFADETFGVLAVFTRALFDPPMHTWLRIIADHAAAAIANANAFEEIERLRRALEQHNDYLSEQIAEVGPSGEIVGNSAALNRVLKAIANVAPTDANVLVTGESGTGKELVARALHRSSQRANMALIKVNCASVPRELFESEFFGHVRGAFTGALRDRAGRFELADQGTLFLDEVGEIPLEMQSKLLRVLQDGEYERIGDERTRKANVRIVAATNRSLEQEVRAGRFRQDLFYRLNVFPIEVPPLRDRKEDIPALARHFIQRSARRLKRPLQPLPENSLRQLQSYDWPGNVRELINAIERALIRAPSGKLHFDVAMPAGDIAADAPSTATHDEPLQPGQQTHQPQNEVAVTAKAEALLNDATFSGAPLTDSEIKTLEKRNIMHALRLCGGKVHGPSGAAERLGIKPSTLRSRIKKLGISG